MKRDDQTGKTPVGPPGEHPVPQDQPSQPPGSGEPQSILGPVNNLVTGVTYDPSLDIERLRLVSKMPPANLTAVGDYEYHRHDVAATLRERNLRALSLCILVPILATIVLLAGLLVVLAAVRPDLDVTALMRELLIFSGAAGGTVWVWRQRSKGKNTDQRAAHEPGPESRQKSDQRAIPEPTDETAKPGSGLGLTG